MVFSSQNEFYTGEFKDTNPYNTAIRVYVPTDTLGRSINIFTDNPEKFYSRYPIPEAIRKTKGSHVAYETSWVDKKTGKKILIESVASGVRAIEESFYGDRKYIRIPLLSIGVDPIEFQSKIIKRLGQKFDFWALITKGRINISSKVVCIELINECLPQEVRYDIAKKYKMNLIPKRSIAIYGNTSSPKHIFVTPNGMISYFIVKTYIE